MSYGISNAACPGCRQPLPANLAAGPPQLQCLACGAVFPNPLSSSSDRHGTYGQQFRKNPLSTYFFGPQLDAYQGHADPTSYEYRRRQFRIWLLALAGTFAVAIVFPFFTGLVRSGIVMGLLGVAYCGFFAVVWGLAYGMGLTLYGGALFEKPWLMNSRRAREKRALWDDVSARNTYMLLGRVVMVIAGLISVGKTMMIALALLVVGDPRQTAEAPRPAPAPAPARPNFPPVQSPPRVQNPPRIQNPPRVAPPASAPSSQPFPTAPPISSSAASQPPVPSSTPETPSPSVQNSRPVAETAEARHQRVLKAAVTEREQQVQQVRRELDEKAAAALAARKEYVAAQQAVAKSPQDLELRRNEDRLRDVYFPKLVSFTEQVTRWKGQVRTLEGAVRNWGGTSEILAQNKSLPPELLVLDISETAKPRFPFQQIESFEMRLQKHLAKFESWRQTGTLTKGNLTMFELKVITLDLRDMELIASQCGYRSPIIDKFPRPEQIEQLAR